MSRWPPSTHSLKMHLSAPRVARQRPNNKGCQIAGAQNENVGTLPFPAQKPRSLLQGCQPKLQNLAMLAVLDPSLRTAAFVVAIQKIARTYMEMGL